MRLVCPNCDATYEVPDSVIPEDGRDVQCSNCGTSWFFDPNPAPEPEPDPEPQPEPEAAPETDFAPELPDSGIYGQEDQDYFEDDEDLEPEPAPVRPRRPLDAAVTDVLREEAAFEAQARAEEGGLEYQDDLPLDDPPEADPVDLDPEAIATVAGSRRDLLPDIDEINSTLRSTADRGQAATPSVQEVETVKSRRRGFRLGFGLVLLLLALAVVIYSYAGPIGDAVPALSGVLDSYVAFVNGLRIRLEDAVVGLTASLG